MTGSPEPTWPEDGPAILDPAVPGGWPIYRRPTLSGLYAPGPISARGDVTMRFAFTEDGRAVAYTAEVDQDQLFRLLHQAGLLTRKVVK